MHAAAHPQAMAALFLCSLGLLVPVQQGTWNRQAFDNDVGRRSCPSDCSCCARRHQVYEILQGEGLIPAAVAKWFVGLAPVAIHLANDALEELEFVEHLPGGKA